MLENIYLKEAELFSPRRGARGRNSLGEITESKENGFYIFYPCDIQGYGSKQTKQKPSFIERKLVFS